MYSPIFVTTSRDDTVAKVSIPLAGNGDNPKSLAALATLRQTVLPATLGHLEGIQYAVTGQTAGTKDFNDQMKARMGFVIAFVLALAFILLLATFRSIVIPITAICLNLLSVGAAYGLLVLIFQHSWAEGLLGFTSNGAIVSWLPMFLFVVLFGLSMDYHVFILSRIKELRDNGATTEEAVSRGIRRTAGTVTSAAIIMVAVFAIFGTLQHDPDEAARRRARARDPDRRHRDPRHPASRDDEAPRRLELVHAPLARLDPFAYARPGRAENAEARRAPGHCLGSACVAAEAAARFGRDAEGSHHRCDRGRDHGRPARCDLRASGGERAPHRVRGGFADRGLPRDRPAPRYGFAGSDQLAFQIQQGAPADVFAAASPKYPEALYRQGLVEKPIPFATNTLVLIVPKANPAGIHSVNDLTKPGVKIVIGDPSVPVGSYTRTVLNNLGISAAVLKNVVSQETDVKGVVTKVALGEADAGFVYVTDVVPCAARWPRSRSASRPSRTSSTRSPW